MANDYLQINSLSDVDFQAILNDYIEFFTKQYLIIETNYKKVSKIKIIFDKRNIHHLLGFHKVQDSNINATKTLSKILEGKITLKSVSGHQNFDDIRDRLLNYNFLHHCFIDKSVRMCTIVQREPNPQRLDIVFIDKLRNRNILLGLKKAQGKEYYVPATMYVVRDNSVYHNQRKSDITTIEWYDY